MDIFPVIAVLKIAAISLILRCPRPNSRYSCHCNDRDLSVFKNIIALILVKALSLYHLPVKIKGQIMKLASVNTRHENTEYSKTGHFKNTIVGL